MSSGNLTLAQWTPQGAIIFLKEAAKYFRNRPTDGEDRAYWANEYNAEQCEKIVEYLEATEKRISDLGWKVSYLQSELDARQGPEELW